MTSRTRYLSALLFTYFLAFHAVCSEAQPANAENAFRSGIEAFKKRDYRQALAHFLGARHAGMRAPALYYNLGSTYYRLKQYEAAWREFEQLLPFERWAALAHYNLGVIAEREGKRAQAIEHFRIAKRRSRDPRLAGLADRALAQVEGRSAKRWEAFASLAGGRDDNVTLSEEPELLGVTNEDSTFVEFLGALRAYGTGERARRLWFDMGVFVKDFAELPDFDQATLRLALAKGREWGNWRGVMGASVDFVYLGGDPFERVYTFNLESRRRWQRGRSLALRNRLSYIEAEDDFVELEGWRNQFDVRFYAPIARSQLTASYQFELNDREDLTVGNEFFSRSPTRHVFSLESAHPLGKRWRLTARAEYRRSEYGEPDRVQAAGPGFIERTRKEDLIELSLRADWTVARPWTVFGEYLRADNESNFSQNDYTRNVVRIGVERVF